MSKLLRRLPLERKQSAHYAIAVQWGRRHEFARANNLSFVFFDDVIRQRLPPRNEPAAPSKLNPVALEAGWLGDVGSWGKDGRLPTIASWKSFRGDRDQACWFPSQRTAAAWRAFVAGTNDVKIEKPAGLGDKKEFVVHAADKPVRVKINIASKVKPATVELWDAHLRLAVRTEAPWTFEVKLPPGVHCLFAAAIGAEQTHMSRPNAFVVE